MHKHAIVWWSMLLHAASRGIPVAHGLRNGNNSAPCEHDQRLQPEKPDTARGAREAGDGAGRAAGTGAGAVGRARAGRAPAPARLLGPRRLDLAARADGAPGLFVGHVCGPRARVVLFPGGGRGEAARVLPHGC